MRHVHQPTQQDDALAARKRAKVRHMKWLASSLLLATLGLLAWSAAYRDSHPWLSWVHAFAEAAAVGAIADWFAVTALFRRPLGLPIPHTAIIPQNKDRLGSNLGEFVEHNFLTPRHVIARLEQRDLALAAADWLAQPANSQHVARRICSQLPLLVDRFGDADVQRALEKVIRPQLEGLDLAPVVGELLDLLTLQGRHQALLNHGIEALDAWLIANRPLIQSKVSQSSKYTPAMLDSFVTRRFVDGVLLLLHEVAGNPDHEVRLRFDEATQDFIRQLKSSPEYLERGEAIKRELLAHLELERYWHGLVAELKARLLSDLAAEQSVVRDHLARAIAAAADAIRDDAALRRKLNDWTLQTLEGLMLRHRHQVSLLISDVIRSWDAREVSERVELEIGKDLQFIRINGTLVGGLVGLVIHGAARLAA
jgi:uncharacterized membrane-anchored protein YjiN (DUF445 family)